MPGSSSSTLDVADDGSVMLKSAVGTTNAERKIVVLLVDDNAINRGLLAHWLRKRGYEFREACDGQQAIDVFSQYPPGFFDVLLLDLSMPVKNGFEAAEEIRKIERTRRRNSSLSDPHYEGRSKIFALTGLVSMEDKRKAFLAGVDGYLVKPVSLKTLESVFQCLKNA